MDFETEKSGLFIVFYYTLRGVCLCENKIEMASE